MNISVNPNGFSELNTVVIYTVPTDGSGIIQPFYVPLEVDCIGLGREEKIKYLQNFISNSVLWRGSRDGMGMADWLEYDLRYDIHKRDYASTLIPNLYSPSLKSIMSAPGVLEVGDSLVPSVSETQGSNDSPHWFASAGINDKTVMVIPGDKFVWKLEFYEESGIESNHSVSEVSSPWISSSALVAFGLEDKITVSPAVTIMLGPDPLDVYNPTSYYLDLDSRRDKTARETLTNMRDWGKLMEEITAEKAIIIGISQNSTTPDVNLSYKSWGLSPNPNRWMNKSFLRNDSFYALRNSLRVIEEKENSPETIIDSRSGIILGTKNIPKTNTIFLFNRMEKTESMITRKNLYTPYRSYNIGDQVEYGGEIWESVTDQNLGNPPSISPQWTLSSEIEDIFTSRILIGVDDIKGGSVVPGGYITIDNPGETKIFEVVENLGYKLNPTQPAFTGEGDYVRDFNISEDIEGSRLVKKIKIWNWEKAVDSGYLTFCFSEIGSSICLVINYKDVIYSGEDWGTVFSEDSLKDPWEIYLTYNNYSGRIDFNLVNGDCVAENIPINSSILVNFPLLEKYQVEKLVMVNSSGETGYTKEIIPTQEGGWYNFKGDSDFSSGLWTLKLIDKQFLISALGSGFEFSNPRGTVGYGTSEYKLAFYCTDSTLNSSDWEVRINGEEVELGTIINVNGCSVNYYYSNYENLFWLVWTGEIKNDFDVIITKK